jgi:tight adherence protein B
VPDNFPTAVDLLIAGAVFGLILALWVLLVWVWYLLRSSRLGQVEKRLGLGERDAGQARTSRLWREEQSTPQPMPGTTRRRESLSARFDRLLNDAGWQAGKSTFALAIIGTGTLIVLFTVVLTDSIVIAVEVAAALALIFWICLKRRIAQRVALFDNQFVSALDLAARSLRAGHPLVGAFRLISEECSPPVGPLFGEICQQQALGVGLEEAIRSAAVTSSSSELKLLATSVVIQLRSGGNLADLMERVAAVTRDRTRLNRRVRVLTAQTQFSKRVLIALPFVIFALLNALNSDYMETLYSTWMGRMLLCAGAASLMLGAWAMNRMAVIRY